MFVRIFTFVKLNVFSVLTLRAYNNYVLHYNKKKHKNKINGNVWELYTEGKYCINDNIIEQVTDFKYLGYRISEYKSDLEDKLQTYNKINGAIWRHFGKQMNKETKLRIHNITAKAALKFGSELGY